MQNYYEFFKDLKFFWFGQRGYDSICLNNFLNVEKVICCDFGKEFDALSEEIKGKIYSLEEVTMIREKWDSLSLVKLAAILPKIIPPCTTSVVNIFIIAYASTPSLESFAKNNPFLKILAVDYALKNKLDDKVYFRESLNELSVNHIKDHISKVKAIKFQPLKLSLGLPFIFQFRHGSTGSNTFIINNHTDLIKILNISNQEEQVIVSKFIDGISVNINACIINSEVVLSYPSIQLVGLKECTIKAFGYCGNDFTATNKIKQQTLSEIYRNTKLLGLWLIKHGYNGVFGLDFIVSKAGEVYPLEINPRFQGSTSFLSILQEYNNQFPISLLHILSFTSFHNSTFLLKSESPIPLQGSQIVLYNKIDKPMTVNGNIRDGIYVFAKGKISFKKQALSIVECVKKNEFVITCGVPITGTLVLPNAPLLKIQTKETVLQGKNFKLKSKYSKIIDMVYKNLFNV